MKKLSLTPYPGHIYLFDKWAPLRKKYKKLTGNKYPYEPANNESGKFIFIEGDGWICFLVFGREASVLAHEFVHCLLTLFKMVGIDPSDSNGEPMCYLLSRLMREALNEQTEEESRKAK